MYGDGVFRYRDGFSVAQIVAFSASLMFAYYFHQTKRIGWFCIGAFSIIRIVSASCFLALINSDTFNLRATVFACESLGIMLFIFIFVELLMKVNKTIHAVHTFAFYIPQILTWIDIAISIAGYLAVKGSTHGQLKPTPYDQASRAIITTIYVYVVILLTIFWFKHKKELQQVERRALACVALCIPLMIVRLTFSLISEATGDMRFNAVKGSPTAYLLMTFLTELGVVACCVATILGIPPIVKDSVDQENECGDEESHRSSVGSTSK